LIIINSKRPAKRPAKLPLGVRETRARRQSSRQEADYPVLSEEWTTAIDSPFDLPYEGQLKSLQV